MSNNKSRGASRSIAGEERGAETLIRSILECIVRRLVAILDEWFPSTRLIDSEGMLRSLWRALFGIETGVPRLRQRQKRAGY